jgi:hypothetical protein
LFLAAREAAGKKIAQAALGDRGRLTCEAKPRYQDDTDHAMQVHRSLLDSRRSPWNPARLPRGNMQT